MNDDQQVLRRIHDEILNPLKKSGFKIPPLVGKPRTVLSDLAEDLLQEPVTPPITQALTDIQRLATEFYGQPIPLSQFTAQV
jgi:hypothetical protein